MTALAVASVAATPGPQPYTPQWVAMRLFDPGRKGQEVVIGASDAAAACNISPYSSALQLYLEKRSEIDAQEVDAESKERRDLGHRLESVILDVYEERQQCDLMRGLPIYFSKDRPWQAATPDAFAASKQDHGAWNVDAKNSNWRMFDSSGTDEHKFGREGTDEVPAYILAQCQHQMAVLGFNRVDIPVLKNGNSLQVFRVNRHDALIASITAAEQELVERIINGDPPEPNWSHSGTRRLLNEMHGLSVGSRVTLGPAMADMWAARNELSRQRKEIDTRYDEITNQILWAAGDAERIQFEGADFAVKRIVVKDHVVTQQEVDQLQSKVGYVGRKGHSRLMQVKA